jgi:acetyl esterase/lipase
MDVIRAFVADPITYTKGFAPKIPYATQTALLYALRLSETSKQWSIRLELTAKMMRSFVYTSPLPSVSTMQNFSLQGFPVTRKMWISKVVLSPPTDDDVRQALFGAIERLKEDGAVAGGYVLPDTLPIEAEWTGYCGDALSKSGMSEAEKFRGMMKESPSRITILYFHGGAYYLMDPATHRPTVAKLAKYTRGRCLSVRYRLAPQGPFPCALLDGLVAYLNLLYPPPGAFHNPIPASEIVFAGDSSGGNLALALLQTLLEFKRHGVSPRWNGDAHTIPLPAGIALNSPWTDITRSMPSCETNATFDYLPTPSTHPDGMEFPRCLIWPASPPRKNFFAEDDMLSHPLVSPLAAKDWSGSPPMWICTGEELLTDEDRHVASKAARQGVAVQFEEWEGMPHCFCMILMGTKPSRKCLKSWAEFARMAVKAPQALITTGVKIKARTWAEQKLDVETVSKYTDEEIAVRMKYGELRIDYEKGTDTLLI